MTQDKKTNAAEQLEVTHQRSDGSWTDEALLREFLELQGHSDPKTEGAWYLARWHHRPPSSGGLVITFSGPDEGAHRETIRSLVEGLESKLHHSLRRLAKERGWPHPRVNVAIDEEDSPTDWNYTLRLGPHHTEPVVIHPNKVLAVGEEDALSPLLGLECSDPVFGLPAKWVTFSQSERAAQQGSLLFDSTELVVSHALNFLDSRVHYAIGLWELNRWLSDALPSQDETALERLIELQPSLLKLVKEFLEEGLYLPEAAHFWEKVQMAITTDDDLSQQDLALLLRQDVVTANLPRWYDESGRLTVVEWRGPASHNDADHFRMMRRLSRAVETASQSNTAATLILMAAAEVRHELARTLRGVFPGLPILAWSDLSDIVDLEIVATVDAELKVDPPPPPAEFFQISSSNSSLSAKEQVSQ